MRRFNILICLVFCLIGFLQAHQPQQEPVIEVSPLFNASNAEERTDLQCKIKNPKHESPAYRIRTVVIDPGHGGKDRGCAGKNSREKDIVLKLSHRLGDMLEEEFPDVRVVYTRTKDVFIPLNKRAKIANQADADLFISLHANYVGKHHVHGSETYVLGLHRAEDNLRVAKRENASILLEENYKSKYDGYDPNSPTSHIILSMYQNAYLDQSIRFAEQVEQAFQESADRNSRGVKQAGFLVLRETTMPSVLIESGFLSHPKEEQYLLSDKGQQEMAQAIVVAFKRYKNKIEQENLIAGDNNSSEDDSAFYVQLAVTSSKADLNTSLWKDIPRLRSLQVGDLYKYLSGPYIDRQDAEHWKKKLSKQGFSDAFITTLQGDRQEQLAQNQ